MLVKGKYLPREKTEEEMEEEGSRTGVYLVMNIGNQKVVHMVIIVQHPRRQPGRCAICRSTRRYTSQCTRPVKPKAKNAEWDDTAWQEDVEWQDQSRETEEHEASKGKTDKGKKSKSKGKSKGKGTPRSITPRPGAVSKGKGNGRGGKRKSKRPEGKSKDQSRGRRPR